MMAAGKNEREKTLMDVGTVSSIALLSSRTSDPSLARFAASDHLHRPPQQQHEEKEKEKEDRTYNNGSAPADLENVLPAGNPLSPSTPSLKWITPSCIPRMKAAMLSSSVGAAAEEEEEEKDSRPVQVRVW